MTQPPYGHWPDHDGQQPHDPYGAPRPAQGLGPGPPPYPPDNRFRGSARHPGAHMPPPHPGHQPVRPWQYAQQQPQHSAAQFSRQPRRTGPVIAICVGVVSVLALGLVVAVSLASREDTDLANTGNQGGPAVSATPPPPSSTSTWPSTPSPSSSRDEPTTRTTTPSAPQPRKVLRLADHPILQDPSAGLHGQTCALPTWQSSQSGAQAFFSAAADCLNAAWGPFLAAHDMPFTPPALHFPTGPRFQTDCGTIEVGIATAAYYCENNLYVPYGGLQTEQYGDSPGVYLALFAHEYGHHVQEMTGMMDAAWEKIYAAGRNSPAGLEMARRKELQAQCFSGMFLRTHIGNGGSGTQRMYDRAWQDQQTRGDDTSGSNDHGSNAHYAGWWRTGAQQNRIADCNTFAAASSEVS